MSFPFYSRSSSKPPRSKDPEPTEPDSWNPSSYVATGAFNQPDASRGEHLGHSRNSSKIRIIPFLGKKRKSMAALRSNAFAEGAGVAEDSSGGRNHYKTVSQLADETAARMGRLSLGAAGSLSTSNLGLPSFDSSPLKIGMGPSYATPTKGRPLDARHTMFPSRKALDPTPDTMATPQNKTDSEKPAKISFLSRVTSRPSLASRYSSADLKSSSKARGMFKSPEKSLAPASAPQRPEIKHAICDSKVPGLGEDEDFFTSPRAAPTPPNLSFVSTSSPLHESPLKSSHSNGTLPNQRHGRLASCNEQISSSAQDKHPSMKLGSSPKTIASSVSLSPDMAFRSPRRHSVSTITSKGTFASESAAELPNARRRGGHVRIGTETVTLSVANVLENELGVEVADSDSSYYDDSYEDSRRSCKQPARPVQGHSTPSTFLGNSEDSSNLPPLSSPTDDFSPEFKFPKNKDGDRRRFALDSQSPLSALMVASSGDKDDSPTRPTARRLQLATENGLDGRVSRNDSDISSSGLRITNHAHTRSLPPSKSTYVRNLGGQSRDIDRLDRISEKSVPVRQGSPFDGKDNDNNKEGTSDVENSPEVTAELQRSLDFQCARFDRLAGHLLQIIQRHQNEKVQFEGQVAILQKEARRNEREIKALRKLISNRNVRSSHDGSNRRLVRVSSMQSFLSNVSANDEEVELNVAVEMLARAGRRSSFLSPDISRDGRASVDLSPGSTPTRDARRSHLRRSKTMPDLHKVAVGVSPAMSSPPRQETSPDISGLGLGLNFPLPEPLKLPSIASTIISSAAVSNMSIPALTTASTVASGLSLATKRSVDSFTALITAPPAPKSAGVGKGARVGAGRSAREKRMAGEWRPGGTQGLYRPVQQLPQPSAPPTCEVPALPASASYASSLNTLLLTSPIDQVMKRESPDLEAIYQKLVANSNGLLD